MDSNKDKKEHKGTLILRLVVLMISLLIINVIVHRQAYAAWRYEAVALENGGYNSIAVDSNNKVHISYFDATDLKYATNVSGTWVAVTVDSSGDVGYYNSIAVDSNNKVHISYYDMTNSDLKYATDVSGTWVAETVDFAGYVGEYTSIAIDSNNKVHISYFDATNSDLKYATNVSGTWVAATVDSSDVGYHTSIAVDSNNKVHISYYDMTNSDLKYATDVSGTWVAATVDSSGDVVGWHTSIAVDSNNKVHISYADFANSYLKYATNVSGSWVAEIVELQIIYDTSIAIDSNNKVHISYNYNPCDYFYVRYATNVSGSWVMTEIDPSGNASQFTSIAIDSNNNAHIIYNDSGLQYATDAPLVVVNDNDNDGYFSDVDCDDNDPLVNPGATEILCNSKDDDCNPSTLDISADLYVSALSAPSSAGPSSTISVSDTTNKGGQCAIGTSTTNLYLSPDTVYSAGDTYLGSRAVPGFGAGSGGSSGSTSVTIPSGTPAGTFYIIGRADANGVIAETNEGNNNRAASIQITSAVDLYVSALSVPGSANAGDAISVSNTTGKSGSGTTGASTTKIYLSTDNKYSGVDTELGSRAVPAFGAGSGSSSGSTSVTIPTNGVCTKTYYLIARADANQVIGEWNEGNNTKAISIAITRPEPNADLTISSVSGVPGTASAGDTISVSDTTNKSGCAAGASTTRVYLSQYASGYGGIEIGSGRTVPAFTSNPGTQTNSGSTSVTIPLGTPSGSYYIIVKADADGAVAETNEDNNNKASALTIP